MITRRSMLLGLGSALAAPAVVRADSLMKLWVPPKPKIILPQVSYRYSRTMGFYSVEEGRVTSMILTPPDVMQAILSDAQKGDGTEGYMRALYRSATERGVIPA